MRCTLLINYSGTVWVTKKNFNSILEFLRQYASWCFYFIFFVQNRVDDFCLMSSSPEQKKKKKKKKHHHQQQQQQTNKTKQNNKTKNLKYSWTRHNTDKTLAKALASTCMSLVIDNVDACFMQQILIGSKPRDAEIKNRIIHLEWISKSLYLIFFFLRIG